MGKEVNRHSCNLELYNLLLRTLCYINRYNSSSLLRYQINLSLQRLPRLQGNNRNWQTVVEYIQGEQLVHMRQVLQAN